MKLHFLVEGPADFAFLQRLVPRLLPKHRFQVYPHQGKGKLPDKVDETPDPKQRGLLDNLVPTLRAWGKSLDPATDRVVVLVDKDDDDCSQLLKKLHRLHQAILPRPQTIFRLAIEETEAWYLGDPKAIRAAFPNVKSRRLKEWQPDSVGNTWELFQEVIGAVSDDKVGWGDSMGEALSVDEPLINRSRSFRTFCRRVREHAGENSLKRINAPRTGKRTVKKRKS